jgi:protein tyrosine kinase modulator
MPEEVESSLNETIGKVLRLIIRRRWCVLGTAAVTALLTIGVLLKLPNHYQSEATLLVVQPQVPQQYVTPTATTDLGDALQAMQREALSRNRLFSIIEEFGLYPNKRRRLAPEQLIGLMLKNIEIEPLDVSPQRRDFNSLRIAFSSDDPHQAQEVTSRLTSIFIEQSLKTREDQATTTTRFLQEQLAISKKKLEDQEARLRDFKMQYLGELPEQQQGNLGILTGIQAQLQATMAGLSRAQEQRVYLQSLLDSYRSLATQTSSSTVFALSPNQPIARKLTPVEAAQNELTQLQEQREVLLRRITPQHPDAVRNALAIAKAEAVLQDLKAAAPQVKEPAGDHTASTSAAAVPSRVDDEPAVAQVKSQLEANRLEIANLLKDERQLKASVAQYQNRLNLTPVREQQLASIIRDYDLLKKEYADLLGKEAQSQLATSLEKRQEGLHFRVVNPANLPVIPSSPKRLKASMGGTVGGVILGLVLAFFFEMKTEVFHTERELKDHFQAPMILGIPSLPTPAEQRSRSRRATLEWLAGTAVTLTVLVAEFYVYRHG